LTSPRLPGRAKAISALGENLVAVEAEGRSARLRFAADRERVEQFVRDESRCCPFFEFEVASRDGETTLSVGGPENAEWAVRGLVAGFVAGWEGLV
jgi:hypothetical protein